MISAKQTVKNQMKKIEKELMDDIKTSIGSDSNDADWGCSFHKENPNPCCSECK